MAKLVLIVGGQAVGKMTVGESLKAKTGFCMCMNHDTIDVSGKIFNFFTKEQKQLNEAIRKDVFRIAVKNDVNLIFTFIWAFDVKKDNKYVEYLNKTFKGELYIVELVASLQKRLERNNTQHRKDKKPIKNDMEWSNRDLISTYENYRIESNPGEVKYKNYIKINNENLSPEEVADIIIKKFKFKKIKPDNKNKH